MSNDENKIKKIDVNPLNALPESFDKKNKLKKTLKFNF